MEFILKKTLELQKTKRLFLQNYALIWNIIIVKLFFQKLILQQIPVRGALSVGKLYTQKKKNIILGEALIEAYEYGENQKWLGFLLTPSVFRHLQNGSLRIDRRLHYRKVDIPGVITHPNPKNVYAFAFNNGTVNGKNPYLNAVLAMKEKSGKAYESKYKNTVT